MLKYLEVSPRRFDFPSNSLGESKVMKSKKAISIKKGLSRYLIDVSALFRLPGFRFGYSFGLIVT